MRSGINDLAIEVEDQKKIQREFDDTNIVFGRSVKNHELQVWYRPGNSRPYKITTCVNVYHGIKSLRARQEYEKRRASDIIKEIDAHNEKVKTDKEAEAMDEVRSTMKSVASGRIMFTPPPLRKKA